MLRNNMGLAWLSAEKHSSPYGTANKPRRVCVCARYMFIFIHQVVGGVLGRRENGRAKKKMVMNTKEKEEKRAAQCKQKRHTSQH